MEEYELIRAYESSDNKELYMAFFAVLRVCIVAMEASKTLKEVQMPVYSSSKEYLLAAKEIQSYFINIGSIKELLSSLQNVGNFAFKDEQNSLYLLGKAIRNKVAHEGIWLPTHRASYKINNQWKKQECFAYSESDIKICLDKVFANRKYPQTDKGERKAIREKQQLCNALKYLSEVSDKGYLDIVNFTEKHANELIPEYVKMISKAFEKLNLQHLSELRKELNLATIEEYVDLFKSYLS